jgi:hypothetical protein
MYIRMITILGQMVEYEYAQGKKKTREKNKNK